MATVTGLTAQRMAEIEGQSVVDGEVSGNNLILTKHNGQTINAGSVRGAPGQGAKIKKVLLPAIKILTAGPGTALTNPAIWPTGEVNYITWSPDQRFLVLGHKITPFLTAYSFDGETLTKIQNPSVLPAAEVTSVSWSSDGRYLAVSFTSSPYFSVYRFDGNSFVKLANPSVIPSSSAKSVSWSPYGDVLSVGVTSAPYFYSYVFSEEVLSKIDNPDVLPNSSVNAISWHPEGNLVSLGLQASPFIFNYSFDGLDFVKKTDPSSLPIASVNCLSWSFDGENIALGSGNYLLTYNYISGSLVNKSQEEQGPGYPTTSVSWAPDNSSICTASDLKALIQVYSFSSGQISKKYPTSYQGFTSGSKKCVSWSPDGQFIAAGGLDAPFMVVQKTFAKYFSDGTYAYAYR